MSGGVVIVGAGQAGVQTAFSLRQAGYADAITLIHDEAVLPYQRPPLSKSFLKEQQDEEALAFRHRDVYDDHQISLLLEERVLQIDRPNKNIRLATGSHLAYDHLVLACGASNNRLSIPGAELPQVLDLRFLDEAITLRQALANAKRLIVIGGGFIGLEVAATANQLGLSVTVLEAADRLMARVVSPEISGYVLSRHSAEGIKVHLNAMATNIQENKEGQLTVSISSGEELSADFILVSVGVHPNTELAEEAGLETDDGILVDEFLTTSDPDISAVGDCARFPFAFDTSLIRLESVQNAVDQARCLAEKLTGNPTPFQAVPWFWSDQADVKLQIAGLTPTADQTHILGDLESGKFSVCCFNEGVFIGTESINSPADHMASRRILASNRTLSPTEAGKDGFTLKAFASGQ
ncbi:MAG: FAD-dependent oxidoreductase [Proteobacteria bacterium]|nr:FAD-dependent oxidoreductase [Pseudomonadota bacterium]